MTAPPVKPPVAPPPRQTARSPYERALSLLPAAVFVLWFLGVLRMHGYDVPLLLLAALIAVAFPLQWLLARRRSARPLYLLPGSTVAGASARSAALVAAAALVTGAVIETQTPSGDGPAAPLWLCALWHGACGFAIAYLLFLRRYRPPPTRAVRS
jgi:hypothetical protein